MRRNVVGGLLVAALAVAGAGALEAQETGSPVFKAPYRAFENNEFGASLTFPEGADVGIEGFYTYGSGNNDFGLRAGFYTFDAGPDNETRFVIGGNFRTRVISYTENFPLDGALTVGAGADFGEGPEIFLIPVGVTLGRRLQLEGSRTTFTPYVHPVLVPFFGSGDVDSDVDFALGLGVDMNFGGNLSLRVNAGVGEIEGVGFSLAYVQ